MIVRSAVLIPALVVFLSVTPSTWPQEPSCRQKFIKICDADKANPVCKLLRPPDKPETPESIQIFLNGLGPLHDSKRKDLICARLMGRRAITAVHTNLTYWRENRPQGTISRHIFDVSRRGKVDKWYLEMPSPYLQLLRSHKELDELKRPAPKSISFDLLGDIVEVTPSYRGSNLDTFTIKIDSVEILRVHTPLSQGDLRAQTAAIKSKLKMAYEEYMNTGFDAHLPPSQ